MNDHPLNRSWTVRQDRNKVVLTLKPPPQGRGYSWSEPLEAHAPESGFAERLEIDEATLGALLEAARRIGQAEGATAAGSIWAGGRDQVLDILRRVESAA